MRREEPGRQRMKSPGETGRIGACGARLSARRLFPLAGRGKKAAEPAPFRIPQMAKREKGAREQRAIAYPDFCARGLREVFEGSGFAGPRDPATGRRPPREDGARAKALLEGGGLRGQDAGRSGCNFGKPERLAPGKNKVPVLDGVQQDPGIADAAGMDAVGRETSSVISLRSFCSRAAGAAARLYA